jgi:hypothetical protein
MHGDQVMPTDIKAQKVTGSAFAGGRLLSGLAILFMPFDGAFKWVAWPIVTATMNKMGYGSSESLMRSLSVVSIVCTLLYSFPPTSFVGVILLTGYLIGAVAPHVRIGSPQLTHVLSGVCLAVMLWAGLWMRDRTLRAMLPFAR